MLSDSTRADLETLLAEQDNGWCAYQDGMENTAVSFGIGGCLVEQMHRLLCQQQISPVELGRRKYDMIAALGFTLRGGTTADPQSMYAWNDEQRNPDVIKHRIKDALNGEYAHAQ
jgi:hypothetical protein